MEYPFDYLLVEYSNSNNKEYLLKAIDRLKKCGFDNLVIDEIISLELEIIKFREIKTDEYLLYKYIWLNSLDDFRTGKIKSVFENDLNNHIYIRNDGKRIISKVTLTLSELVSIFDEAWFINNKSSLPLSSNILNECKEISKYEDTRSWVVGEFKKRIEECYRRAHDVDFNYDRFYTKKEADMLYESEMILLAQNKWEITK